MLRLSLLIVVLLTFPARAGQVLVAVAANFTAPMKEIASTFEKETGHKAKLAFGATGAFAAQIRNGAPFDLLLAADEATPATLEEDGFAVRDTRFTYAIGRLALWSPIDSMVDKEGEVLRRDTLERIAIANPKVAPYGRAAVETMQHLGVYEKLKPRLVQGESIAQAYQFVASGNVPLGFVALSQVGKDGSCWIVPQSLHAPLKQDAVILAKGRSNAAAFELAKFLKGGKARGIMRAYGYGP